MYACWFTLLKKTKHFESVNFACFATTDIIFSSKKLVCILRDILVHTIKKKQLLITNPNSNYFGYLHFDSFFKICTWIISYKSILYTMYVHYIINMNEIVFRGIVKKKVHISGNLLTVLKESVYYTDTDLNNVENSTYQELNVPAFTT